MKTYQNTKLAVRALKALRGGSPDSGKPAAYYDHALRKQPDDSCFNCPENGICDLLADLRHLCDSLNLDFAELDLRAYRHYQAELYGLE